MTVRQSSAEVGSSATSGETPSEIRERAGALQFVATSTSQNAADRLQAAYPEHVVGYVDGVLVWRDGSRMRVEDGGEVKQNAAWLTAPDLKDIFRFAYDPSEVLAPPHDGHDPGRARPAAFFEKMYGDCRKGDVSRKLVEVAWLPSRSRTTLKVTQINGVADRLAAVSAELDALPRSFDTFLLPTAGTYNCRTIAGTGEASAHGYGIAIDIAIKHAHYWRWPQSNATRKPVWRNAIPAEIVRIFEKHGFIWGGRWHHYDTMHFEYRPELLLK